MLPILQMQMYLKSSILVLMNMPMMCSVIQDGENYKKLVYNDEFVVYANDLAKILKNAGMKPMCFN